MLINHPSIQRIRFRENNSSSKFGDTTLIIETDISLPRSHDLADYSDEFAELIDTISRQVDRTPVKFSSLEIRPYRLGSRTQHVQDAI